MTKAAPVLALAIALMLALGAGGAARAADERSVLTYHGGTDRSGNFVVPALDPASQAIYVEAAVGGAQGVRHLIFALALKDGAPLPGWPVDTAAALRQQGQTFNARDQNERGALAILDGRLYVPFGGHFGDCGDYHGWVVGISLHDPKRLIAWSTRSRGGGIWAPGGITVAEQSLFVATGNTFGASTWSDGEAIIRLAPDLHRSNDKRDFFAPSDWHAL